MPAKVAQDTILVLDFGSQYSQLIARRVREAKVYCELVPGNISAGEIRRRNPRGLIFSGGPARPYRPRGVNMKRRLPILIILAALVAAGVLILASTAGARVLRVGVFKGIAGLATRSFSN